MRARSIGEGRKKEWDRDRGKASDKKSQNKRKNRKNKKKNKERTRKNKKLPNAERLLSLDSCYCKFIRC